MENFSIAVDFGGTRVKAGIFEKGHLLSFISYDACTERDAESILGQMKKEIDVLIHELNLDYAQCIGIGMALPGIVNVKDKKLVSINDKYNHFIGFNMETWCRENMGLETVIENDANAALLGEDFIGTTQGSVFSALCILGTGVGTAVMMNGQLIRGAHYQAGCLGGHLIIDYKGRVCNCGSTGCLEAQASTWALNGIVKSDRRYPASSLRKVSDLKMKDIVEHAAEGDPLAKATMQEFIQKWSAGLVNLIHAYDPEVIVLSGGIVKAGDILIQPLIERTRQMAWMPSEEVRFIISDQPEQSVLYGMNRLVMEMKRS